MNDVFYDWVQVLHCKHKHFFGWFGRYQLNIVLHQGFVDIDMEVLVIGLWVRILLLLAIGIRKFSALFFGDTSIVLIILLNGSPQTGLKLVILKRWLFYRTFLFLRHILLVSIEIILLWSPILW